jgi:predicted MFS family arabinose efflux permease
VSDTGALGAPVGGVLVAQLGATTALWLDAGSFVVSAVLVTIAVPASGRRVPAETPRRYGALGGAALAGAVAFNAFGHRLPRRRTFVWAFAITPLVYLTLATLPSFPVALAALAVSGLVSGPINPLLNTVQSA